MPHFSSSRPHYRHSLQKRRRKPVSKAQGQLFSHLPQRRERKSARRGLFTVLCVAILIGTLFFLFFSKNFRIQKIIIERRGSFLENNPFKNISAPFLQKNIFLFDTEKLQEKITAAHPEIQKISIKKLIPSTIKISLTAHPLAANLTNTFSDFKKRFQINDTGMIVTENKENAKLPYFSIATEKSLTVGQEIIDEKKLTFALTSIKMFEEMFKMKVVNAAYLSIEREVHLRTEKGFIVWLDAEQDLEKQLRKLKRALPSLDIYNMPLSYIDLRISGIENEKIFYKKK